MNNTFNISSSSFEKLLKGLSNWPEVDYAILFGSRAMGNSKKASDIDIAVFGKDLKIDTVMNLKALFNEELPIPYFVDIVAPELIDNPNLKGHIINEGVMIYNKSNNIQNP